MTTKSKKPKSKWRPAPEEMVRLFEDALASFPQAQKRKMFGYPAAFVNGRMFTGLHQESMVVKLPAEDRAEFMELAGAEPFEPMPGRVMGEFVVVPEATLDSESQLHAWLEKSFEYVKSLPPKKKSKGKK